MSKGSKIFFTFLAILTIFSIGVSFYRYIILKDVVIFENEEGIPTPVDIFKENLSLWKI